MPEAEDDDGDVEEDIFREDGSSRALASAEVDAASDTSNNQQIISYRQHLSAVSKLTYPIILSEFFQNTLPVMDIAFVGQLGKDELAAAALATVWFNLWNATMIGFMTAIDTLLSQSYGANQIDNFAIWTGNSLIIISLTAILVAAVVALCGPAMRLFGQDPELAKAAGEFSFRLIPGLFPYYLFKVLTKYLQTQNRLAPGVWIGVLANGINALFNWALIFAAGWGIVGAPWATTITRTMEFLLIVLYIYVKKNALRDTLPIFSRENLTQSVLKPFWKLAISGALSITAEAWSFEITTILAGLLGTVALDAHIITLTIATFLFLSFPFAIGIAASIRVGQLIGNSNSKDAQRSSHTSYVLSTITQAVLIAILLPLKDVLGHLFSSDDDVANLVSELIPISCIFMIGDSFQATTGGVLRGLGRQKLVLWLNLLGFWVLAVPIGAILAFAVDLGVFGLWWGMVIGIYLSAFIGLWSLRRVNWNHEAKKTLKRLSSIISTRQIIDPDGTSPAENVIDSGEVS
jgi:MATE family multidrug resistance protein